MLSHFWKKQFFFIIPNFLYFFCCEFITICIVYKFLKTFYFIFLRKVYYKNFPIKNCVSKGLERFVNINTQFIMYLIFFPKVNCVFQCDLYKKNRILIFDIILILSEENMTDFFQYIFCNRFFLRLFFYCMYILYLHEIGVIINKFVLFITKFAYIVFFFSFNQKLYLSAIKNYFLNINFRK